jgi:hypothetical protein
LSLRSACRRQSSHQRSSLRVQPPFRAFPTNPSLCATGGRQRAPPMSFLALQHIKPRRSTWHERCLLAMFRPQGLATLSTTYSLRGPAGFVSHRRRSWASPFEA